MASVGYLSSMNNLLVLICFIAFVCGTAMANEIRKGDTLETVYEKLGKPSGVINLESKQFIYYARGHLEVIGGRVVKISMVSEEQYRHDQEVARRNEAIAAQQARERRDQRIAEGHRVKDRVLNDPDFVSASGSRQIRYWKKFSERFPEIDIREEITAAADRQREERIVQLQAEVEQQRIANLERQLRDAQDRAAEAERDVRRLSNNTGRTIVYANPYAYGQYQGYNHYSNAYGSTSHSRISAQAIRPSAGLTVYGNRVLPGKVQVAPAKTGARPDNAGSFYRPSNYYSNPYNNRSLYNRPQSGVTLQYSF